MHRTTESSQQPEIRTLCSHFFPAGDGAPARSYGSPALGGKSFCFYHHPARPRVPSRDELRARTRARRLARRTVSVPTPTTRLELQNSFAQLINLIAAGQVDNRRGHQLLAALNASSRTLLV